MFGRRPPAPTSPISPRFLQPGPNIQFRDKSRQRQAFTPGPFLWELYTCLTTAPCPRAAHPSCTSASSGLRGGDGRSLRPALSSWSAFYMSLWVPGGYSRGVGIFPFPSLRCAIRLGPPLWLLCPAESSTESSCAVRTISATQRMRCSRSPASRARLRAVDTMRRIENPAVSFGSILGGALQLSKTGVIIGFRVSHK